MKMFPNMILGNPMKIFTLKKDLINQVNHLSDDQIWKIWKRSFQMVCRPLLFDFWFPRYGKLKILDLPPVSGTPGSITEPG